MSESLQPTPVESSRLLEGVRICLVFEHRLTHYTRLRSEIAALQSVGATVELLTAYDAPNDPPDGIRVTKARIAGPGVTANLVPASAASWRCVRIADNLLRKPVRFLVNRLAVRSIRDARRRALELSADRVDLFWVIDFPSLPAVVGVAVGRGVPILYETVDLVPEYLHHGERHRLRSLAAERELLPLVAGFITACDSYADYYMERYGDILPRRPVVRDNMPENIVSAHAPTRRPLKTIFLGSLMFDRPVMELLEAVSKTDAQIALTVQGRNLLGEAPARRLAQLGLEERVRIVDPCPPEAIVETAAAYDLGIVALRGADENERRTSTSKLFTYMSAGLAILGSNLPGIARVVNEHRNGILVDGMEPTVWAKALEQVTMLAPTEIDRMKQASVVAARHYSWEVQKPAFLAEFARALQGSEIAGRRRL